MAFLLRRHRVTGRVRAAILAPDSVLFLKGYLAAGQRAISVPPNTRLRTEVLAFSVSECGAVAIPWRAGASPRSRGVFLPEALETTGGGPAATPRVPTPAAVHTYHRQGGGDLAPQRRARTVSRISVHRWMTRGLPDHR